LFLPVIDDSNYFPIDLNILNRANLFIKEAKYQAFDSIISTDTTIQDFHLVDNIERRAMSYNLTHEFTSERADDEILKIYIRLDK
jgi:hypothetical protein